MKSRTIRCAIYTRKSSDEGLEQSFNSLDAQREAGEAYIKSQAHEGWKVLPTLYDDGGYSGGTMERPGLRRLLDDVDAGLIDVVVVYKIDRLTRSLPDFARIVERFDGQEVSFVSVTQAFNTTSSMGRLTLNVLLSFAQFEREVTGERIRDKIAASKAKGMWMGGLVPLGYDLPAPGTRTLQVNETEAVTVRHIFARYLELGSVHALQRELAGQGIVSKQRITASGKFLGGQPLGRGALFHLLRNRLYLGEISHKGTCYPGEHEAIVARDIFEKVAGHLDGQARRHRAAPERRIAKAPLAGRLFDIDGTPMSPSFSRNHTGRHYRYYVSSSLQQGSAPGAAPGDHTGKIRRIAAPAIEKVITGLVSRWQPAAKNPIGLPLAVRLMPAGLLIELPGKLASSIAHTLSADETIVHTSKSIVQIRVPLALPLRGGQRLIIPGTAPPPRPDANLIAALRKAHGMLSRHRGLPLITTSPVSQHDRKLLRLAFLAPDLQRDILAGHQPPALNLERLRWMDIPLCWKQQREVLGWQQVS